MKLANPAPLGSFGFALTTWLLGMIDANLLPAASTPVVVAMALPMAAPRNSRQA